MSDARNRDPLFARLADHLHRRELAAFCGAGISMDPPTSLPSWRALTDGMLAAVGEATDELAGPDYASALMASKLPPELIAQKLHDVFGDDFFHSLDVLLHGEPNLNHLYLAALAKTGRLRVIITANFDTFIEKALRALEVPYRVYRRDTEFADFLASPPPEGEAVLIKIHGCIEAKDTIIATLKDTGRGLADAKKDVLGELLKRYVFLFLGYSGNDFNLDDNKIAMRDAQASARGFIWNFRPGETNPVVEQLVADYDGRGRQIAYTLPDLLVELHQELAGSSMPALMRRWATGLPPEHFRVLGELLHHAGHLEEARICYELQSKTRNHPGTRSVDPRRRATALHNLGRLAADRGNFEEALDAYQRALQLEQTLQDSGAQAETLHQLGHLYQSRGELATALDYYEKARAIQQDAGHTSSAVLHQIGAVHHERGELDAALAHYREALALQESSGDHESMAATLHQTGLVYHAREQYEEALTCFDKARRIEEELGIRRGLAPTLAAIGLIHLERENHDAAREHFRQAKEIEESLQNRRGLAACEHNLGIVAFETGDTDLARWHFDSALKLREAVGDTLGIAGTLDWIGEIQMARGDGPAAKASFLRGADIYRDCGVPDRAEALRAQADEIDAPAPDAE